MSDLGLMSPPRPLMRYFGLIGPDQAPSHPRTYLNLEDAQRAHGVAPVVPPVEWGIMPNPMGPLGDALDLFSRTARGPFVPPSAMSPESLRMLLSSSATLMGLGPNEMTHALRDKGR